MVYADRQVDECPTETGGMAVQTEVQPSTEQRAGYALGQQLQGERGVRGQLQEVVAVHGLAEGVPLCHEALVCDAPGHGDVVEQVPGMKIDAPSQQALKRRPLCAVRLPCPATVDCVVLTDARPALQ